MKKKNRQNFTINEKISEEFKEVCDRMSVNMSKLIENYMVEYIKLNNFDEKLYSVLDNLDNIKIKAFDNYKNNKYDYTSLNLSDYQEEEIKIRKIITRIIHSSNIIAEKLKYGAANICIMNEKYYNMVSKYFIEPNEKFDKRVGKFIGDIKVIKNDKIGNFILTMKLLSDDDLKIINIYNNSELECDITNQYAGFEIVE